MNFATKVLAVGGIAILGILIGVFGVNVFTASGSQTKLYGVKLTPDGNSGDLKVKLSTNTKKCNKKVHDGCMLFETDKVGQIKFYVPGSAFEMRKCSGTTPKAKNVITKIELAVVEKEADEDYVPDGSKGDFNKTPLADWIKYDAFSAVNLANGIVYEAPWDKAATQVFLENLNSHNAELGVLPFWYRVTVTACNDEDGDGVHETWVTDPRGDNEGLK